MIGKMIRYYRELKDLSQEDLAGKIFLQKSTIGHYETGYRIPDINKIELIAEALEIETAKLLEKNEAYFKELEFVENDLGLTIIKESLNILAIKKLIIKLLEKNKENKLVIISNELSSLTEKIMLEYYNLRKYIYFYHPDIWGPYPFDEARMSRVKDLLSKRDFAANDKATCVYNHDPRYDISVGCRHTVVSEGIDDEYGFEILEVVTLSGNWGTFPKDWFELDEKGNPNAPVPRNRFLDILNRLK